MSAKKGTTNNIYNQTLRYYNPVKGTAALYSGNISEWSSQQASLQQETYGFTYDLQGRLTQSNRYSGTSTSAQNAYTERGITYDKNGNILTLQRYAAALQDNYTYTYNGSRLTSISGTDNGTAIVSASYSYDNNGNTVQDGLNGLQITYNILNLPQSVTQSGTTKATYGWFADGSKYSVQDAQGNGYCYIGSLIYSTTAGAAVLESTDFSGGRIVLSGNTQTIHYHHKDHLGSVRAITDGSGSTIEQNAYYPFGGRHTFGQTYTQTTANRYKFNGKELQTTGNLGLLDYGARMYDTKIARWLAQDPLAEKYYPFSAYNYCVNNPVMFVDPDGKDVDLKYLSKLEHRKALEKILSTQEGIEFIGRYMKKGQILSLNGKEYEFHLEGDRSKDILLIASADLGEYIIGLNKTYHKGGNRQLSESIKDDMMKVTTNGVKQVIYLHNNLDESKSISTLAHEIFVHTTFSADMLTMFDNMQNKTLTFLQNISNKGQNDHHKLGQGVLVTYKNVMKKLNMLNIYFKDVQDYKNTPYINL